MGRLEALWSVIQSEQRKEGGRPAMLRTPSPEDELFAQAAAQAAQTDPVLHELEGVLDRDPLYQQVCAQVKRSKGATLTGEVLVRLLLVKYLYAWSDQQLAEQAADSL